MSPGARKIVKSRLTLVKGYLLLAVLGGFAALGALAAIPSDSSNALVLGFSASRIALLAFIALPTAVFGLALARVSTSVGAAETLTGLIERIAGNRFFRGAAAVGSLLLLFAALGLLLLPSDRLGGAVYFIERLRPVCAWLSALAAQTLLLQLLWRADRPPLKFPIEWRSEMRLAAIVFVFLLAVGGAMAWSGIGLAPDRSGWYPAGTPLLVGQVTLAGFIGIGYGLISGRIRGLTNQGKNIPEGWRRLDALLGAALWVCAALVWMLEPMRKWSYFSPEPAPPNFDIYPYSDAAHYDEVAQGLLIGISREGSAMLRPLYSFFLALLHLIGGQEYRVIQNLQIVALAAIPVLVYRIGSSLGSRPAGLMAAILVILREQNSIALTNVIEVSHSKLLLSDMPALALMLLFVYVCLRWLQDPAAGGVPGLISGAALGLLVLVRSQAQLLVPVVMACLLLTFRLEWRKFLRRLAFFLVGLLLVIAPWIWRNDRVSGRAAVENPEFYARILASGYVHSPAEYESLPGETPDAYYSRMRSQIVAFILENPSEVLHFWASHFLHNEVSSVVYLPMSPLLYSLRSYVREMGIWADPTRSPAGFAAVMVWINVSMISIGIASLYRRAGPAGLIPLLIHLGYSLSVVPIRLSGSRFILPADWVTLMYYCFGLTTLAAVGVSLLTAGNRPELGRIFMDTTIQPSLSGEARRPGMAAILAAAAITAVLGLSLPVSESLAPKRYPEVMPSAVIDRYAAEGLTLDNGSSLSGAELSAFLDADAGAVAYFGRALYPVFYPFGKYWGDDNPFLLAARQFDRLQFKLIGPANASVFLPLSESPKVFPQAADVLVIGCSSPAGVRALAVRIQGQPEALAASPWNGLTCRAAE